MAFDFYAPRFEVKIADQLLPAGAVLSVEIDESIDKASSFTIGLNEDDRFNLLNEFSISIGSKVTISIGYKSLSCLMKGKVNELSPGFSSTERTTLKIGGLDLSYDLQKKKETRFTENDVKYSQIAQQIATAHGLKPVEIDNNDKKHNIVKRNNKDESDYALLKRLAEKIGYEFFVREDGLYFRAPREKMEEVATFKFGKDIINFNPSFTTASILKEVVVRGWNEKSKSRIEKRKTLSELVSIPPVLTKFVDIDECKEKRVEREVFRDEDEAIRIAEKELKSGLNDAITGTLECIGNPALRPGVPIKIEGVGELFSGKYYIKSVKHSLNDSGYLTSLEVRRCFD